MQSIQINNHILKYPIGDDAGRVVVGLFNGNHFPSSNTHIFVFV